MKNLIVLENKQKDVLSEYMPNDATLKKLADFFSMFSDSTRVKIITIRYIKNFNPLFFLLYFFFFII